jgi:hypothetical protein
MGSKVKNNNQVYGHVAEARGGAAFMLVDLSIRRRAEQSVCVSVAQDIGIEETRTGNTQGRLGGAKHHLRRWCSLSPSPPMNG